MKPACPSCPPSLPEAFLANASRSAARTTDPLLRLLLLALLVLGLFALAGCAFPQAPGNSPAAAPSAPPSIAGKWRVDNSSAVFEITASGAVIAISGLDSSDGEAFVITNVKWDGLALEADFLMPSTDFSTHSRLSLADKDTLSGKYADGSPEIWRRVR